MYKKALYLVGFLLASYAGNAQINVYMGGSLQGNYSFIRGDEPTMAPGFGGGLSFVYWEYEYWFLKAGLDFYRKSSSVLDYPDPYGVDPVDAEDRIHISYTQNSIGIPLTVYFRPYEWGANTILITGSLTSMFVANLKLDSEEYGELVLKGSDLKKRVKSNVGIGIGYQRQLDTHMFLNLYPSYNIDLRGDVAFNSITLTAEFIFGVY